MHFKYRKSSIKSRKTSWFLESHRVLTLNPYEHNPRPTCTSCRIVRKYGKVPWPLQPLVISRLKAQKHIAAVWVMGKWWQGHQGSWRLILNEHENPGVQLWVQMEVEGNRCCARRRCESKDYMYSVHFKRRLELPTSSIGSAAWKQKVLLLWATDTFMKRGIRPPACLKDRAFTVSASDQSLVP